MTIWTGKNILSKISLWKNFPSKILLLALVISGCSVSSVEDFSYEAEGICRQICKELEKVESREDFMKVSSKLKDHFDDLVDVMISMRQFQEKYPDKAERFISETWPSIELQAQMERLYSMEGGRAMMEKVQKEALLRLDAFEKNLKKQKSTTYRPR